MRGQINLWLKYVKWYLTTAIDPAVSIEEFFNAPIVSSRWKATREDPVVVRFGQLWRLYDLVAEKGLDYQVPILGTQTEFGKPITLLGGISGQQFLVFAAGIDQPAARRGVVTLQENDILNETIRDKTLGIREGPSKAFKEALKEVHAFATRIGQQPDLLGK